MGISNLGYVGLTMTDPTSWVGFGEGVLGLKSVDRPNNQGAAFLKADDHPFRILVLKGDVDKFAFAGWDCGSKANFDVLCGKVGATALSADEAALRAVTEVAQATDPAGNVFELFHTRTEMGEPFKSPLNIDTFVMGDMGMGHVVLPAPNQDETHAFYTDVLGFGDSDDLKLPPPAPGAPDQRLRFMHADNPRHHSLALYNYDNPTGVIHIMLEVTNIDEVGECLDRAKANGAHILASLGRHENDKMVSFYMFGPGGIAVEYGYDGLQVDWATTGPTESTLGDYWGHEYDFPMPEGV